MEADRIEASRHDPLLRLDQFIHRQDEMILWQREIARLMKILIFELAGLILIGLAALIFSFRL